MPEDTSPSHSPENGTSSINQAGWHVRARRVVSPNADERPAHEMVALIVVHNISLPPGNFGGPAVEQLFTNSLNPLEDPAFPAIASLRVSAHFFISRSGDLTQFVSTTRRAWHAGESAWRGLVRCNDFSVGIELEGTDVLAYTERQYRRLSSLTRALLVRHPTITGVAGHSEIAPDRKTDPGDAFDWAKYLRQSGLPQRFRNLH